MRTDFTTKTHVDENDGGTPPTIDPKVDPSREEPPVVPESDE